MKVSPLIHKSIAILILFLLALGAVLYKTQYQSLWETALFFSTLLGSTPFVLQIAQALREKVFAVDGIAILAILSALATGETLAAAIVLFMLSGGESLESYAEKKAKISLEKLLAHAPTTCTLYKQGEYQKVAVQDVREGDLILVKKGETVPVDGVVEEGQTLIDESVVTGEAMLKEIGIEARVLSGSINIENPITIKATATYEKSVFSGIVRLVKEAQTHKAHMVTVAGTYSIYFTIVTIIAATIAYLKDPLLAVAVLVVATPCPLILAAPIAFISGMSKSAKRGIIVKHGDVFEALNRVGAFFFDKTGTLTLGHPEVSSVVVYEKNSTQEDIISIAASLEQTSPHILADAVVAYAKKNSIPHTASTVLESTSEGLVGEIAGATYTLGTLSFLESHGVNVHAYHDVPPKKQSIYVAKDDVLLGVIYISDRVRSNAHYVLKQLKKLKEGMLFMLISGDKEESVQKVGKELGFTHMKGECLPEDKEHIVEEYERKGIPVAMIGDGINDAPSLARASVGIAIGSHGATVATDIADAVIVVDDIERVYELALISRRTVSIAVQSIAIGMGLSVVAMAVAYAGYLPPVTGAILQEGIDILVIANALRALV